jgi:hypothetical protein
MAALCGAGAAGEGVAQEDRYGPAVAASTGVAPTDDASPQAASTSVPYAGPYLNWTGKRAPPTEDRPAPPPAPLRPPSAAASPSPVAQDGPPAAAPTAPTMTAATPPPPRPPVAPFRALAQNNAAPTAGPAPASPPVGVRFYSVLRDYGLSPDPVTPPADRPMVLIGPADNATGGAANADAGADHAVNNGHDRSSHGSDPGSDAVY